MRTVLMVAFHYPPYTGSSGLHRTTKFVRYLPRHGWSPVILSAHPRAFPPGARGAAPRDEAAPTYRAFSLDAARHLSLRGASLGVLALPDRWATWWIGGVAAGLRAVRRHRPHVLWSTYPIATAHLIGLTLQRLTGLPWVADFRDPLTENGYPADRLTRRAYAAIERGTLARASAVVFTTESCRALYVGRYPRFPADRALVIPNGYDEADFADLRPAADTRPAPGRPLRIVHAGTLYPEERDPTALFAALSRLKKDGLLHAARLRVELRASGADEHYASALRALDIDDVVRLLPPLPYRDSLQDSLLADGFLLIQGPSCNAQIPAKAYEYLRARRPILALAPAAGDTAALLRGTGGATLADPDDEEALYHAIPEFLAALEQGRHPLVTDAVAAGFARHTQAAALARCLDAYSRS
jgi:glycosyltransferase involved in cell wall biosynthesis